METCGLIFAQITTAYNHKKEVFEMKNWIRWVTATVLIMMFVCFSATVQIREGQLGIITSFGKPVKIVEESGLHWKWPFPLQQAILIDGRSRVFETRHTEMLTGDKKNIILLSYAVWKVDDPLKFYQAVGSIESGDEKMDGLITNIKIGVVGKYDLSALVSTNPDNLCIEEIEEEILKDAHTHAQEKYGILVEQVGFKRLSLPEENVLFVLKQMRAERMQHSAKFRAEGEQQAALIRSETYLEAARIRSEGMEKAAVIRGEAEKEAASIYSSAHSLAPEFYTFLRSLESLDKIIGYETTVILRTDSEPFKYLKSKEPKN